MAAGSPYNSPAGRRVRRAWVGVALIAVAAGVTLWILLHSSSTLPRAAAAPARHCPAGAGASRAAAALKGAQARYALESRGSVGYLDLQRIAHDATLLAGLGVGERPRGL